MIPKAEMETPGLRRYFEVVLLRMGSRVDTAIQEYRGEEIPVLIHASTGIPFPVALLWLLKRRSSGFSSESLARELRAVGWLYEATAAGTGLLDFDDLVLNDGELTPEDLRAALGYMNRRGAPVGAAASMPPRDYNFVRSVWFGLLDWLVDPHVFRPLGAVDQSDHAREARHRKRQELKSFFESGEGRAKPAGQEGVRTPLSPLELRAIEAVVLPDEEGNWPDTFSEATRERNAWMYRSGRWAGFRIGETLKVYASDVPPPPPGADEPPETLAYYRDYEWPPWVWDEWSLNQDLWEFDAINLERRPDDPAEADPRHGRRGRLPKVKSRERTVVVGEAYCRGLRQYVASSRATQPGGTPYLFTARGRDGVWRPVSISTARQIMIKIRVAATAWMEKHHPGVRHTLGSLIWHRLRHTRATELLPIYLDDLKLDPHSALEAFVEFFGWSSIVSAAPYTRRLRRQRSDARLRTVMKAIEAEVVRRRAERQMPPSA
jgi:hypothetical protein